MALPFLLVATGALATQHALDALESPASAAHEPGRGRFTRGATLCMEMAALCAYLARRRATFGLFLRFRRLLQVWTVR